MPSSSAPPVASLASARGIPDIKARPRRGRRARNPDALGVSRVVEIDTAGGPGFGFEQFKAYDFLRDREVVLTFDDGPWPGNTQAVPQGTRRSMHQGPCFFPSASTPCGIPKSSNR